MAVAVSMSLYEMASASLNSIRMTVWKSDTANSLRPCCVCAIIIIKSMSACTAGDWNDCFSFHVQLLIDHFFLVSYWRRRTATPHKYLVVLLVGRERGWEELMLPWDNGPSWQHFQGCFAKTSGDQSILRDRKNERPPVETNNRDVCNITLVMRPNICIWCERESIDNSLLTW